MAGIDNLKPDPTAIGDISSPPFARLPDPSSLFATRAARLHFLAQTSPLKPYLAFLEGLATAQDEVQSALPEPEPADRLSTSRATEFGMPLIDRDKAANDETLSSIFDRLFAAAEKIEMPEPASKALSNIAAASTSERRAMAAAIFSGLMPANALAEHVYVWAGLQLHFARLASTLDVSLARPVADGVCPICGSMPSSSMVVGWTGSHGARFCACSLCNTLWHYVRIKCILCGSTKGIGYEEVEGGNGAIKAETCDECQSWVKIFYQQKTSGIEPIADDVASLGLDMLMRERPYQRGGFAPLLAGF